MANSLFPAWIRLDYTSLYGAHSQTIPTVNYIPPEVAAPSGKFELRGATVNPQADSAIEDLVDLIKPLHHTSATFLGYTIFTQPDVGDPAEPQYSGSLGVAGTQTSTTWKKAVQATATWRTDRFGIFKMVFLDIPCGNTFDPFFSPSAMSGALAALDTYLRGADSIVAGRDGGIPKTFLQISFTLNEKLRKAYRMM